MLSPAERDDLITMVVDQLLTALGSCCCLDGNTHKARALVHEEVSHIISTGRDIQPAEVARLEERLHSILQGKVESSQSLGASSSSVVRARKHMMMASMTDKEDEWAVLAALDAVTAQEERTAKTQEMREKKLKVQGDLKAQTELAEQRKKLAKDAKKQELEAVDATIREWRKSEIDKRQQRWEKMQALKEEREKQLAEQRRHAKVASALRRVVEAEAAATNTAQLRQATEAERAAKHQAREQLERLLATNAAVKAERERHLRQEAEQDTKLMQEYAASLERQDQARAEQLAKIKAVQARQAEDAATHPEFKRWMDPAVTEKQLKAHEAKVAEEERKRATEAAALLESVKVTVACQLKEKKEALEEKEREKKKDGLAALAVAQAAKQAERDQKLAAKENRIRLAKDLNRQVESDFAALVSTSGMNETEKKMNATLLKEAKRKKVSASKGKKQQQRSVRIC